MTNKKTLIGIALAILLLYFFGFFSYLSYQLTLNSQYAYKCDDFINSHPEKPAWNAAVRRHKADLRFEEVKNSGECSKFIEYVGEFDSTGQNIKEVKILLEDCLFGKITQSKDIDDIKNYLKTLPNGTHIAEVKKMEADLWENFIQTYEKNAAKNKASSSSVAFFKKALSYVRATKKDTIFVTFDKKISLKDWEDYPKQTREILDQLLTMAKAFNPKAGMGDITSPLKDPPPSLKSYFVDNNVKSLEGELLDKLSADFKQVLGNKFVILKEADSSSSRLNECLSLQIKYTINNLTTEFGGTVVPELYQHYQTQTINGVTMQSKHFEGHLLGIGLNWDADFIIPKGEKLNLKEKSRPASEFSNIQGLSDAYRQMTKSAFIRFAEKIANQLGITDKQAAKDIADEE